LQEDKWIKRVMKVREPDSKNYKWLPNPDFDAISRKDRENGQYRGKTQCDASDKRTIELPDGTSIQTTLLKVGEFDILAAGLFGFRGKWDFGYTLNRDLPRSTYSKYPPEVQKQLIGSLVPVTWPLETPFVSDPFILLDKLVKEKLDL
jgi:hypothetical protein